ncbi:hypothetical protein V2J09_000997 [Rumex salicifolius]
MVQLAGNLPNKYTFSTILKACVGLLDLSKGKEVHAVTSLMGLGTDVLVCNALIDMYCKCGDITYARKVFDKMPNRDVASWTSMISGYCNLGMLDESMALFNTMKLDGIQPNDFTWNSIIAGYARSGDCDQALQICNRMTTEGLVPDLVTWNALISGFAQGNQAAKAVELFKNMIAKGIKPNSVTITGLLPACELGSIQAVREIHSMVYRLNLDINVYIAGALVDTYAKCGSINYANNIFEQTQIKNNPMWNALIGCHARHGLVDSAIQLFERMQRTGFRANQVTLVCILSACSHGGLVEKGMEIFRSMKKEYGVEANKEHYACVVDLLCRAGRMEDAYEMVIRAVLIEGSESALGAFFNGCQIHGRRDLAKRVAQNLLQMEFKRPGGFVTLSNIYAANGDFDEVENIAIHLEVMCAGLTFREARDMGRGRGKGKKLTVTSHEDAGSGEEEKIPIQKRRGRPQKPMKDDINEDEFETIDEDNSDSKGAIDLEAAKKRKRNPQPKDKPSLVKEENGAAAMLSNGDNVVSKSNGFRHIRNRRKSTPHRAAEVGVKGTIFLGLEASPHQLAGISSPLAGLAGQTATVGHRWQNSSQ